jgi:hypothetical protein
MVASAGPVRRDLRGRWVDERGLRQTCDVRTPAPRSTARAWSFCRCVWTEARRRGSSHADDRTVRTPFTCTAADPASAWPPRRRRRPKPCRRARFCVNELGLRRGLSGFVSVLQRGDAAGADQPAGSSLSKRQGDRRRFRGRHAAPPAGTLAFRVSALKEQQGYVHLSGWHDPHTCSPAAACTSPAGEELQVSNGGVAACVEAPAAA